MHINNSLEELLTHIAIAADLCIKPWAHSVVDKSPCLVDINSTQQQVDLILSIQCRNKEGDRFPENDIEVEIYQSGNDLSITLSWESFPDKPILWYGNHSLWMDSTTGKKCQPPKNGSSFEALARRIRSSFIVI